MELLREESRKHLFSEAFSKTCADSFDNADTDRNGKLDLRELRSIIMWDLTDAQRDLVEKEDLFKQAFDECDADKNNLIDRNEYEHVMRYVKAHVMEADLGRATT